MDILLRKEQPADYFAVESLIRDAFWDMFVPGCNEHYLAHVLRHSVDYIDDLSFVALVDDHIVGVIMYTRSKVIANDKTHEVLTFGPLAVGPEYQGKGIGAALIQHTVSLAQVRGEQAIIIFGHPEYYHRFGFEACAKYHIVTSQGFVTDAFMVLPLNKENKQSLDGTFVASATFDLANDVDAVDAFDRQFPQKTKGKPRFPLGETSS